jgi:hypothetical protein
MGILLMTRCALTPDTPPDYWNYRLIDAQEQTSQLLTYHLDYMTGSSS